MRELTDSENNWHPSLVRNCCCWSVGPVRSGPYRGELNISVPVQDVWVHMSTNIRAGSHAVIARCPAAPLLLLEGMDYVLEAIAPATDQLASIRLVLGSGA